MAAKPRKYRYVYMSAVTGKFVSASYAQANPDTTYRKRIANKEPLVGPDKATVSA